MVGLDLAKLLAPKMDRAVWEGGPWKRWEVTKVSDFPKLSFAASVEES